MLEAACYEGEQTPECHDQLGTVALCTETGPDGKTDKHVAEDAAQEKPACRRGHLS